MFSRRTTWKLGSSVSGCERRCFHSNPKRQRGRRAFTPRLPRSRFGLLCTQKRKSRKLTAGLIWGLIWGLLWIGDSAASTPVAKKVLRPNAQAATELAKNGHLDEAENAGFTRWAGFGVGYERDRSVKHTGAGSVRCANTSAEDRRGVSQAITFDHPSLAPIVAAGWSKADNVSGAPDSNYSIYVDLVYEDGTPLWGQTASFPTGTHDWEYREVVIVPERPVKQLTVYGLFRHHTGTAWFDDFSVRRLDVPQGAMFFDGALVTAPTRPVRETAADGGQVVVRDAAADSDFYSVGPPSAERQTRPVPELGLQVTCQRRQVSDGVYRIELAIADQTGQDRAINLYYLLPLEAIGWRWWDNVQEWRPIEKAREYSNLVRSGVGATGYQSLSPFSCVSSAERALSFLVTEPRICRTSYDARQQEYVISFSLGLSQETKDPGRASATFHVAEIDPQWAMRATAQLYYRLLPKYFDPDRVPKKQGNWMAFTKISSVDRPEDFFFAVHEGNNDVAWDNQNGILPFVYVEPMTFWMSMPPEEERSNAAAMARLESHLARPKSPSGERAWAVKLSGLQTAEGQYEMSIRDTPWCNGAVFANCADPDVPEDGQHLNQAHLNIKRLSGAIKAAQSQGGLAGIYLDSLEGWGFLQNWRREHWKAADLPLTYDTRTKKPVLLNVMSTYEFTSHVADWMRSEGKLLMANSVPHRFPWLANPLDVMGTETNWLRNDRFAPPSADYMYLKRTMAWHKPYMFLMNTHYDDFGPKLVEQYMQRCLFYGMFPGFFSEDASSNPYFGNPKWYNRDRHLFRKYLPVIQQMAEAGWQPVTLAQTDDPAVWVERFGKTPETELYFTVMNTADKSTQTTLTLDRELAKNAQLLDLLKQTTINNPLRFELGPKQVMALRVQP